MSAVTQSTPSREWSVLIIQLGGIEEVLRSLMALKAVKHLYPELKIHFVARPEVSAPLKRIDWLSSLIEIPVFSGTKEESIQKVAFWIDQVIHQKYEFLMNWTTTGRYQRMGAIITTLIPAVVKFGFYFREDFTIASYDAWSMYLQGWVRNNTEQDIHPTDIITTQLLTALQIHVGDPNPAGSSATVTSRYFFKVANELPPLEWNERPKNLKWVAIHVGSMKERGSEFVDILLRRHPDLGVVFFGEQNCEWEIEVNPRVIDLTQVLHFDSLIQILSQCIWLISGRSPLVDLASLINLRVLFLTTDATLKWTEDGPYGNTHLVIQSPETTEKPELIYAAWSYYQSEWFHKNSFSLRTHFENLGMSSLWGEARIYKSRIRIAIEGGGVSYELIGDEPETMDSWMFRLRGKMARAWFCGWLPNINEEVEKYKPNPELIKNIRNLNESVIVLERISREGKDLAAQLAVVAESVKSSHLMSIEDRNQIDDYGKKLLEIESLINRVVQVEPRLNCFIQWYQQLMHNLSGETIAQMAKETVHAFELVIEGVDLLKAYSQKTLDFAKPKSVTANQTLALAKVLEIDT